MRRKYLIKYLQILFFIIFGSINFLNAIKTGNFFDWLVYAACMIGMMVVAFSIKKMRDADRGVVEEKPVKKEKKIKAGK